MSIEAQNGGGVPEATDVDERPSVSEVLRTLSEGEDMDTAFIIAGVINLQIDALKRLQIRMLLGPVDVQNMFRICRVMLTPPEYKSQFAPRRRQ